MADVASTLAGWSSTTNSNSPSGSTTTGSGLDDNLREIQGVLVRGLSHKGSDIASATTTDLGAVEGLMHDITGTTTITGFGTVRAGIWKIIKFEGALTLTHNATSLILPSGSNITTADGDVGIFISEGSGNWRCLAWLPAGIFSTLMRLTDPNADRILFWDDSAGKYDFLTASTGLTITTTSITVDAASDTVAGRIEIATQAEMETPSSTTLGVTPGRVRFHPGVSKAWVKWDSDGVIVVSNDVSSITDTGTGNHTINWGTAFSTGNYVTVGTAYWDATNSAFMTRNVAGGVSSTAAVMRTWDAAGAAADATNYAVVAFGDQ